MKSLDRVLQCEILEYLKSKYPEENDDMYLDRFRERADLWGNVKYLLEHRFIRGERGGMNVEYHILVQGITAEGLDFLEDDGGISAILRTVTIRFDANNLRNLIEQKILTLNAPEHQKETAIEELKKLPVESLKTAIEKLIDKGLEHMDLLSLLRMIGVMWPN